MMDKLRTLCESALVAGVLVNRENIFKLARLALEYSCFSKPADNLLGKCAKFLKREISRDFGILKRFGREDYDIFQVLPLLKIKTAKVHKKGGGLASVD